MIPSEGSEERSGHGAPCPECRHLYTTWRPATPRGCRGYGFESLAWPSEVVRLSSGAPCQLFEARPRVEGSQDETPPSPDSGLYG